MCCRTGGSKWEQRDICRHSWKTYTSGHVSGALWQPEMGVPGLMLSDFSSQGVSLRRVESLLSSMQCMANSTQTRTGASIWRGVYAWGMEMLSPLANRGLLGHLPPVMSLENASLASGVWHYVLSSWHTTDVHKQAHSSNLPRRAGEAISSRGSPRQETPYPAPTRLRIFVWH